MTPNKLLVCSTRSKAEAVKRLLELDDSWRPIGFGEALMGSQFEKIIVFDSPNSLSDAVTEARKIYVDVVLRCRLSPSGVLILV